MTELKKAARMALEQLEFLNACYPHKTAADTITALTQALAATEPVADPCPGCQKGTVCRTPKCGRLKVPAPTERRGEPVAYFVTWPGDPVGMRRFYGADEWEASRKTVEYFGGVSRPLIFGDTSPQVPEDTARLDWIERQSPTEFSIGLVFDYGHEGNYWCSPKSGHMYYGTTPREAIDAARKEST